MTLENHSEYFMKIRLFSILFVLFLPTLSTFVTAQEEEGSVISIAFGSDDDPKILNPALLWSPGSSDQNLYKIGDDGSLAITAGPFTNYWGTDKSSPVLSYPVTGDFVAQVKVVAEPEQTFHVASLGVRSAFDTEKFIRSDFYMENGQILVDAATNGTSIIRTLHSGDTVYLRIERNRSLYRLDYSFDGLEWVTLAENSAYALPEEVEVFLNTYSTSDQPFTARFSDFTITTPPPPRVVISETPGYIPIGSGEGPMGLSPSFVWYNGNNDANSYEIEADASLTVIAAPFTNYWGSDRSASVIALPTAGNFTTQVHIEADPRETYHVALLGIRSAVDADKFIRAGFYMQNGNLVVSAEINGSTLNSTFYNSKQVNFQISRHGSLYNIAYSIDREHWVPLVTDYEFDLPDDVEIFMSTYSTGYQGFPAHFYDFTVLYE
jgi:regulation of enolase protein 1 (concanavalin A-like superfamily)